MRTRITKTSAVKKIEGSQGRFFTVEFIKKDGNHRVMNCQYVKGLQGNRKSQGYVVVKDAKLRRIDPLNCIRNVCINTIKAVSIRGKIYIV